LIGAVAATQLRRAREAALLKALGLGRLSVVRLFAVEYVLLGTVAGLLGAGGSYLLTSLVVQRVLEMDSPPSLGLCALGFVITVVLSTLGGLLASLKALLVPPLEVLRQEG
jgi:putative ABC transport system permease protein